MVSSTLLDTFSVLFRLVDIRPIGFRFLWVLSVSVVMLTVLCLSPQLRLLSNLHPRFRPQFVRALPLFLPALVFLPMMIWCLIFSEDEFSCLGLVGEDVPAETIINVSKDADSLVDESLSLV